MNKLLRLLFLTVLLSAFSGGSLHAQQRFGVMWNIPESPQIALDQLRKFEKIGISAIEIKEQPAPGIWQKINDLNLQVYGNLNIPFPLTGTFAEPDSLFIEMIERRASTFLSQPSIHAIGLFEFGPVHKAEFIRAVEPFVNQLKQGGEKIYFKSSREVRSAYRIADFFVYHKRITPKNIGSFKLPIGSAITAYQFSTSDNFENLLRPFRKFLKTAPDQKTVLVESKWLFSMMEKYPQFNQIFSSLATEADAVFPVPDKPLPEENQSSVPILSLLLVWGSTAILYSSSPLYRKSLFRYFTAHRFFIKDIFARHIRSPLPAVIIIFQNAVLLSTGIFVSFSALFSPLGENAFYHHFPALTFLGSGPFSLFIWTFLVVLALSFISIIWLYSFHKELNSIKQVATIYAWPLQLNLVVITIAIAIFSSAGSGTLIAIFCAIAFLIFLMSFIFASVDVTRYLKRKPKLYFLTTSGLYLTIIGALIVFGLTRKDFWDVISLALNLK